MSKDINNDKNKKGQPLQKEYSENGNIAYAEQLSRMNDELRTPLSSLMGTLELLMNTKLDSIQEDYIHNMHLASENLMGVFNNILDISLIETNRMQLKKESFNPKILIEDISLHYASSVEQKEIKIITDISQDIPNTLIADSVHIKQILENLLSNAIKYSRLGTDILILAKIEEISDCTANFIVEVTDKGIGMSEKFQKIVFEKFNQSIQGGVNNFAGTGLGLTLCKQLLKRMGGDIQVKSKKGKGSTFTFSLPVTIKDETNVNKKKRPPFLSKILLIDADKLSNKNIALYLKSWKMTCSCVDYGIEGFKAIQKADLKKKPFDIVIINKNLPILSPESLISMIRTGNINQKPMILVIQSQNSKIKCKCNKILTLPYRINDLHNALLELEKNIEEEKSTSVIKQKENKVFYNILLVEDDDLNQEVEKMMLQKLNCEVSVASNGDEAIQQSKKQHYDLILMDIQMPGISGLEASK
ncbi:MAG: ATP-binding protein [Verrucomicrobiota bacterium]|nr:ATP-binding protein [Verrucomicrobiota bacterium]